MEICRTVVTATPLPKVWAYLADFTHTNEWDPGTVNTELMEGDGGVGTRYANVSRFAGRKVHLTYVVEEHQPEHQFRLRAVTGSVTAVDTMTFAQTSTGGTAVTYRAEFAFTGPTAVLMPLLAPAFRRLGDRAEHGMRTALDALAV